RRADGGRLVDQRRAATVAGGSGFFAVGSERSALSAWQGGGRAGAGGAAADRGVEKISARRGSVAGRAIHAGLFSVYERRAGDRGASGGGRLLAASMVVV